MPHTFTQLNNGLRVLLYPMPNIETVAILIMVRTGSKYENKRNNGISHFLEHMIFKGTKNRSTSLEISMAIEGVGGAANAFTGKEYTGYYIKIPQEHLNTALDVISDIYQNSLFQESEINKERGVIIEEINMYNDLPQKYVSILLEKLLYKDQPAGWDIAGAKENVKKIQRDDFIDYINKHYSAENTILCVAGKIDKNKTLKLVNHYFSKIKKFKTRDKKKTVEKQNKPEAIVFRKNTDQAHLNLAFRAFNIFDERKYSLSILSTILGGNMSSRLFQIIRDKLGLAYYIGTNQEIYTDTGYFEISAGLNVQKAADGLKAILNELNPVSLSKNIKEEEIKQAKEYLKGAIQMGLEDSFNVAYFYCRQSLILNKILSPGQIIKKLEKITKGDIIKTAQYIFKPEKMNLALIGPFENKNLFHKILTLWL